MLRKLQIEIVLIFLVAGVIIIGTMGYINYNGLKNTLESEQISNEEYIVKLGEAQNNIRNTTIVTIVVFSIASIVLRNSCNRESGISNFKTYKQCKENCIRRRT